MILVVRGWFDGMGGVKFVVGQFDFIYSSSYAHDVLFV